MDIRDLLKVLILICAVIYVNTGTKQDEKELATSNVVTNGNHEEVQNDGTVVKPPKDGNYKLSYAAYETTWRNYKRENHKKYTSTREEKHRFAIFMENVKKIEAHNMEYHLGQSTYWMDINQFSDWTQKEFEEWLGHLDVHSRSKRQAKNDMTYKATEDADVPESIDWSEKGFVTQVKNQAQCGSCYAFSTTGSVEGQWFRKTRKLINLSEQQIVDCSTAFGNNQCKGGHMIKSFEYIISAGGLQNETTYPYKAENGTCKFNKSLVVAKIKGYLTVAPNEAELKSAVGIQGPVSVSIYVNNNFKQFAGGIYNDSTCIGVTPNHAVLVVGYGSSDGKDYWIVKNCWGSAWGSNVNATGYIKMARNTGGLGMCSIAGSASFPLVSEASTSSSDESNDDITSSNNWSNKLENNAIIVLVTSTLGLLKFTQLCF